MDKTHSDNNIKITNYNETINYKTIKTNDNIAVNLISFENNQIKLNDDNLKYVLDKIPSDIPISIISIIGAFRTGKSFLLNIILKFLKDNEKKKIIDIDLWFNNIKTIPGNKNNNKEGFLWCNGIDSQTMGIWIWKSPIMFDHPINGKTAIILMDSQGLFDLNTNQKKTISLFGLSSLISSHIIYNIDKRIQEDNLQHLALFSAYGQLISDKNNGKCLQTLQFLIRDWQNFDKVNTNFSNSYIDKIFSERKFKDLNNTRNQIKNCFNKIICSFLPHPGLNTIKTEYKGRIKDLDKNFIKFIKEYLKSTFLQNILEVKKIGNTKIYSKDIYILITKYLEIFKNEKGFPKATTILESTIMIQHNSAIDSSLEIFRHSIDSIYKTYMSNVNFNKLLEKSKSVSLKNFEGLCTLGDTNIIEDSKNILLNKIDYEIKNYNKLNEAKRPLKFMGPYIVPFVSIMVSMAMTNIFSICSTSVSICSELYLLFSICYYLSIFTILIFIFLRFNIPFTNII